MSQISTHTSYQFDLVITVTLFLGHIVLVEKWIEMENHGNRQKPKEDSMSQLIHVNPRWVSDTTVCEGRVQVFNR